jgi:hypothetical protein
MLSCSEPPDPLVPGVESHGNATNDVIMLKTTNDVTISDSLSREINAADLAYLRKWLGKAAIPLPQSAREGHVEVFHGLDEAVLFRCTIDATDLKLILDAKVFNGVQMREDRRFVPNDVGLPWWKPDQVKRFKSCEAWIANGEAIKVLVDLDEPEVAVLYIMFFGL